MVPIHKSILRAFARVVLCSTMLTPGLAVAQQLPTGGSVTHGSATIGTPQNGTLTINQSSNSAIINWNTFSIGAGGTVNFNQPGASSATLNRVTGSASSSIAGTINAPGTVLLVNPNGIAITKSGVVNTGAFAASTLDIKDSDFLAGNYTFGGNGASATVTNSGRINVADGGFAALLGGRVANDGVISARLGKVGLGSGELITLDMSGDGFLSVAVPSSQLGNLMDGTGKALVTNSGRIRADGGTVFLSAATASNILRDAVNVPGSIRADTVGTHAGRIVLGGGAGGRVTVSGRLAASGRSRVAKATGGRIDIGGAEIALAGAKLDVSGTAGGGSVRIGGDARGGGTFQQALNVSIDSASVIRADALDQGNGGSIVVWSTGSTSVAGTLSARGGANGGNGGSIETSGHDLAYAGIRVDTSAPKGATGNWLLDPVNLTIDSAAAATISANLQTSNVTLQTTASSASGPGVQSGGAGDITVNAPISWTSASTLALNAYANIFINGTISGGAGSVLWLTANNSIQQTAPILVSTLVLPLNFSGSVTLTSTGNVVGNLWTDQSSIDPNSDYQVINPGSVAFTNNGNLTVGTLYAQNLALNVGGSLTVNGLIIARGTSTSILTSGDILFTPGGGLAGANASVTSGGNATFEAFTSSGNAVVDVTGSVQFNQNITAAYNAPYSSLLLRSRNNYVSFANGKQIYSSAPVEIDYNPYAATGSYANSRDYSSLTSGVGGGAVTGYMLVNNVNQLQAVNTNVAGAYALGGDIDASATAGWQCAVGCAGFTQLGSTAAFTGVFDGKGHAILGLTENYNGAYIGPNGGVLGPAGLFRTNNGTIRNLGLIGGSLVAGNSQAGGIASTNNGTITNSYTSAMTISGNGGNSMAGGLVGLNNGTINGGSYSTATVSGYYAGGLVGINQTTGGIITDSYSAGAVSGATAGGIAGLNGVGASIAYTYSLSSVHGTSWTGGLVGENQWGGAGSAEKGSIQDSYAAGPLSGTGVGGIAGKNGFLDNDTMDSFNSQSGMSARVFWTYWDQAATGATKAFGYSYFDMPGGWSSDQVQYIAALNTSSNNNPYALGSYTFFDNPTPGNGWNQALFQSHWYIVDGATRPFLTAEYSTNIQNLHQLQLVDMNGTASYTLARNINAAPELASGMWANNSFSPITPVSYSGYFSDIFVQNVIGNSASSSYDVWNDGVLDTYITIYSLVQSPYTQVSRAALYNVASGTFTGTLDGQGHTISNLYVNSGTNSAGVFSMIAPGGTVKNLGILDGRFIASSGAAGSIAGVNEGLIWQSYADRSTTTQGTVAVYSDYAAGGLAGYNNGTIANSYTNITVEGVGQQSDYLTFTASVGGIAGYNASEGISGLISNSYATGLVLGNGYIGGLVGSNASIGGAGGGTIVNSYSTGNLAPAYLYGVNYAGPLVGRNTVGGATGTVTNSLYVSDATTVASLPVNQATNWIGTGATAAQMQDLSTFRTVYAGWDFRNVWIPPNNAGQSDGVVRYPQFYWANHVAVVDVADATQVYGNGSPVLAASVYGLKSYDTPSAASMSETTTANAASGVGTYQITGGSTVLSPSATGTAPPATNNSSYPLGVWVNGSVLVTFTENASATQIAAAFNAQTYRSGVTASVNASGAIVVSSQTSFSLVPAGVTLGDGVAWLHLPAYSTIGPRTLNAVSTDGTAYRVLDLPGTLTVTPRPITVTADSGQGKVYGNSDPALTYTVTSGNLVNGDTLSGAVARASGENAGNYAINAGTLGTSANYAIDFVGSTFTIAKRSLTVTLTGSTTKQYDGTTSAALTVGNYTLSNVVAGDQGSLSVASLPTTGSYTTADVGSGKSVSVNLSGVLSGSAANNYTLPATASGAIGTITAAPLTITVNDQSPKTYGTALALGTSAFTAGGLFGSDSVNAVTLQSAGAAATAGVTPTPYAITGSNALGSGLGNYTITYVNGSLTVIPAQIAVTANGGTSIYGQSPANPGLSATGLQNGETVSVLTGLSNSFGITATTGVGGSPYTLSVIGTLTNPNYVLSGRNTGSWTVTPAPLIVTANGGTSVYGQSPANPGLSATGLQNGETVSVLAGLSNSFGITSATGVGGSPYTLSVIGTLTNPNYAVSARNAGSWTVTPASLTVTADAQSKMFTAADSVLTYQITGSLFNGDTLTGALTRVAGEAVGTYAILQGTLGASRNYTVSYVGSLLTITAFKTQAAAPGLVGPPPVNTNSAPPGSPPSSSGSFDSLFQGPPAGPAPTGGDFGSGPATTGSGSGAGAGNDRRGRHASTSGTMFGANGGGPDADPVITGSIAPAKTGGAGEGPRYLPISEYDAKQYSNATLPPDADHMSEAAVFTMLARGASAGRTTAFAIDSFSTQQGTDWNGATGAGALAGTVTFSDGAGHLIVPDSSNAFTIATGATDFAHLLTQGPVMIGGNLPSGPHWLLATRATPDGIVANDPISGRQVLLAWDPGAKTLGGITRIVDPKLNGWVALSQANAAQLAGDVVSLPADRLSALQGFVATSYYAVTVK